MWLTEAPVKFVSPNLIASPPPFISHFFIAHFVKKETASRSFFVSSENFSLCFSPIIKRCKAAFL